MTQETLTAERQWVTSNNQLTVLRDEKGAVKKIISSPLQQPKKKDTTVTVKGITYNLKFK